MTFAPALTWMHLFPAGMSYACHGGPAWFRDALRPSGDENGGVRVVYEQDLSGFAAERPPVDGLVAINCTGLDTAALASAGYGYVRRFAAIPNIATARWFIPLDNNVVSSSAFKLYSPTRLSARLKRATVQLMARAGLPGWYRDEVWIVQKTLPPLEQMLAAALPKENLRLALSAGAPEPARNRKATAALLRLDGSIVSFAKISGSTLARRNLEREAAVLSTLSQSAARDSVPRLIASANVDDRFVLVQTQLTGRAAPAKLTTSHYRFLASMEADEIRPAVKSELVATLDARLAKLGDGSTWLGNLLEPIVGSLQGLSTPRTIVHGDFAPWNFRCGRNQLCAFDWEYGRTDGLPMIDQTHHELQVGYLIHEWTVEQAAARLDELATGQSRYSTAHAVALQNVYLLDVLLRLADEGYGPSDPMIAWHLKLVKRRVGRPAKVGAAA